MRDVWKNTLASIGFKPHGPFGAMWVRVEDVEYIAVPHPPKGLAIMATHYDGRSKVTTRASCL